MFDCSAFIEENLILNVNEVKIKLKTLKATFCVRAAGSMNTTNQEWWDMKIIKRDLGNRKAWVTCKPIQRNIGC